MEGLLIDILDKLSASSFSINQDRTCKYVQSPDIQAYKSDLELEKQYTEFLNKINKVLSLDSIETVKDKVKKSPKRKINKSIKNIVKKVVLSYKKDLNTKISESSINKKHLLYNKNILNRLNDNTDIEWIFSDFSNSQFLLHTILSTIDEIYSLSKNNQKKKYLQQTREHIAITIGKEFLGAKIKMASRKQFSVASLQKYVQQETSKNRKASILKQVLPFLYSEYFKINLIEIKNGTITYLNQYTHTQVSILITKIDNIFYGIVPKNHKYNWITDDIILTIKNGFMSSHSKDTSCKGEDSSVKSKCIKSMIKINKSAKDEATLNSFKLRSFYSYKLPELQELAKDFGIYIWKVADTREKIYQKNVKLINRKTASMKTKSKNKTKKELYEELKDKINSM